MPLTAEVTPLADNRVRLDVAVPEDEVKRATERTIRQLGREVRVPGFRPGKVPAAVVVQRVGMETVVQEMLKSSLADWYQAALAETGVEPIDDPDLNLEELPDDAGDLTFQATVHTRPKATLGDLEGLEVGKATPEVPEGAVDAELERLRDLAGRLQPVERAAGEGDFVVIDFDGSVDGRPLREASARDYLVQVGAGRLVGAFDQRLRGMSAGESASFAVDYGQDDRREELRGRRVDYEVTVKSVQEKVLPPLDDDLAAEVSEHDTLEALRADVYSALERAAQDEVDERFRRAAIDAVVARSTVDVPQIMVDRRVGTILGEIARQLPEGVSLETYLQAGGRTLEQVIEELKQDAEMALRRELVVEALAAQRGVEVFDAEVEEQVRTDAAEMGRPAEEVLHDLRHHGGWEALRKDMVLKRGVDELLATVTAIPLEQAQAREKLWTPEAAGGGRGETGAAPGKLWTPGQPR
jgi:trigger factor